MEGTSDRSRGGLIRDVHSVDIPDYGGELVGLGSKGTAVDVKLTPKLKSTVFTSSTGK